MSGNEYAGHSAEDYFHIIDDLVKENGALRKQRDEYAIETLLLSDKLAQLENCTKCDASKTDSFSVRMELSALQKEFKEALLTLPTSVNRANSALATGIDECLGAPSWASSWDEGYRQISAVDSVLAELVRTRARMEKYRIGYVALEVDNSELREAIAVLREGADYREASRTAELQAGIDKLTNELLEIKTERNAYRAKYKSLSKQTLQLQTAISQRAHAVSKLYGENKAQNAQIKDLLQREVLVGGHPDASAESFGAVGHLTCSTATAGTACRASPSCDGDTKKSSEKDTSRIRLFDFLKCFMSMVISSSPDGGRAVDGAKVDKFQLSATEEKDTEGNQSSFSNSMIKNNRSCEGGIGVVPGPLGRKPAWAPKPAWPSWWECWRIDPDEEKHDMSMATEHQ